MQEIYYRKSKSEYEKGYFISSSAFIRILIFFASLFLYYLYILDLPFWIIISLMVIDVVLISYLLSIDFERKNEITINNNETSAFGLKINDYLSKYIKKKKGKIPKHSYKNNFKIFIGQYEFDSIIYSQNLLDFYENCLAELDELKKNDIKEFNSVEIKSNETGTSYYYNNNGKINWEKFRNLKWYLNHRIEILKRINEKKL